MFTAVYCYESRPFKPEPTRKAVVNFLSHAIGFLDVAAAGGRGNSEA